MDPQKELNLGPANYAIEPFRTENLSSLFELYRRVMVFPDAESITEYWQWRFGRNPFDDGTRPPFWVAKRDGNIVGALAQVPVILDVAGHPIRAYWAADFMVDPEVRGRGLGKQIFSRYRESNPMVLSMGYSPRSVTSRVARAVGFRSFPAFSYAFKFYSVKPIVTRFPWTFPLVEGLSALLRPFLGHLGRLKSTAPAGIVLREISRFDDTFDLLWRRVAGEVSVAARRTHATMNWRYVDNPFFAYRVVGAWRHGELRGCVVLKVARTAAFTYGTIPEIIVPKGEVELQECLLAWALEEFARSKVDVVKSLVTPPHLSRLLRRSGFFSVRRSCDFVFQFGRDFPDALLDTLLNPGGWYLTKGDADLDMVPDFMRQVAR